MDRNLEPPGDRLVGRPLGDQRQHIELARGQGHVRRRLAPGHEGRIGGLARRREPQARHVGQERRQPIGELRLADLDRDDEGGQFAAHRLSGRSPIVRVASTGSPARRSVSLTLEPTLSGPSARTRWWTPRIGSPFHPTMMSPCRTPAAAPGPLASTLIAIAPTPPPSSLTACSPRPRYPRAILPFVDKSSATRSIVAMGMTSVRRRGPKTAIPNARPSASSTRPPSLERVSAASSSIRASMTPPRRLRHCGPTNDTTPSAALGAPSRAPTTAASAPAAGGSAAAALARSVRATRSTATSLDGSRPTIWAALDAPPWAT